MRRSQREQRRTRSSLRRSFQPLVECLEDRLVPVVGLPTDFAEVAIVDSGLASPAALEVLPDGRVLVALQGGTIRVVQNDALLSDPLITLSNVDSAGERGLLGITLDPNFATNNHIYVYYTANASATPTLPFSHNRLSRLTVTGGTAVNEQVLWELPSIGTAIWHMGGAIHFGPDGKIYVSVGDHQMPATAQSMTSMFGKIHRLDVSGPTATIPTDNPFYATATGDNRSIWALGLRNPFTSAFQPGTSRFYLNDVGEGTWEEVNDGAPARNFGWPTTEGPFTPASFPAFTNPLFAYRHSGAAITGCAVSGGAFYNPAVAVFPTTYAGKYFFQDFCSGWIKTLDPATAMVSDFATGLRFPVDMRVSDDGAIYYITRGAPTGGLPATGGIGKIVYTANPNPLITRQPASQTVARAEPAAFTVTVASPTPVTYQWQRNGADIPGATAAGYTISATVAADTGARFRVIATNAVASVTSNEAVLTVIDSARPTGTITSPAAGATYRGGDTVAFAGTAIDPEDGPLPASAYTWQIDFHHDTHVHPFRPPTSGITGGSFVVPTNEHPEGTLSFRIYLTVRDSAGLTHSTFRDITPERSQVTLTASHPGLRVNVNGQPRSLPLTINAVINTELMLDAPLVQAAGGTTYEFVSWSDSGPAAHTVLVPAADTTYTATYRPALFTFISDLPFSLPPINGWGPIERDRSNGEQPAGDGRPITLNGVVYAKGLGVHARSEATFDLAGQYTYFLSDVGLDDEVAERGTVSFEVWADGVRLFDSGVMNGSSPTRSVAVNVTSRNQLRLIVLDGGDGNGSDHADWANAQLTHRPRPTGLRARSPSATQVALTWLNNGNESGTLIERSLDGGVFEGIAVAGPGATSFSDAGLVPGAYLYRVRSAGEPEAPPSNTVRVTLGSALIDQSGGFVNPDLFIQNGGTRVTPNAEAVGTFAGHQDVGTVGAPGSAAFADGIYTVRGSGADIWGTADAFHFVYRPLVGNGEIVARVTSVGATDYWAKAAVMIRDGVAANARHAMVVITPPGHDEASFQRRLSTGGSSTAFDAGVGSGPAGSWIRLVRSGDSFSGFRSADGVTWTELGAPVTIPMAESVFVGLAVTAHNNDGRLNTSTFDNVSVMGNTPPLVPPAQLTDGATSFQAGSIFSTGQLGVSHFLAEFTFQVRGGTDTSAIADGVAFVIQTSGPQALGGTGGGMGYAGLRGSVAVKFDVWDNEGETNNSTGLFADGRYPSVPQAGSGDVNVPLAGTGIDLLSRRPFHVSMVYDGTALNVTLRDTVTGAFASQSYVVDIPALVGSTTAYVGFTGATGSLRTINEVQSFRFQARPAASLHPDPCDPTKTALVAFGTSGNDTISFEWAGTDVELFLNGVSQGIYSPTGRLLGFGLAGDDNLSVPGDMRLPVWFFGGDGDDHLKGGRGDDVLVGGAGDDHMNGSRGRDLLIGGAGGDRLSGGRDDDLLVAGTTAFDAHFAALCAVADEWTADRDLDTRADNLRGTGEGPRLNGSFFLQAGGEARTVFDDGIEDRLDGGSGEDWTFAADDGEAPDDFAGELFDDLD